MLQDRILTFLELNRLTVIDSNSPEVKTLISEQESFEQLVVETLIDIEASEVSLYSMLENNIRLFPVNIQDSKKTKAMLPWIIKRKIVVCEECFRQMDIDAVKMTGGLCGKVQLSQNGLCVFCKKMFVDCIHEDIASFFARHRYGGYNTRHIVANPEAMLKRALEKWHLHLSAAEKMSFSLISNDFGDLSAIISIR